jgi:hypothetical protein
MNKIDIKKYKYAIIAVLILLTIVSAVSNVFYKKTSPNVVDNSKLTGYFSNNMYYNEKCTTDTDFDIREEFDLEVASEETIQKIRDKIEWLKGRARGEGFRKGEVYTMIAVSSEGNSVNFYDAHLGVGGGRINTKKLKRFLDKNSDSKFFEFHTHDFNSNKDAGFMCELEGEDKCNPDNPPSLSDLTSSKVYSDHVGSDNFSSYVVEQDGDIWKFSIKPGSKIDKPLEEIEIDIKDRLGELEAERRNAFVYCDAEKATKDYLDYFRSVGAEIVKISSGS